MGGGVVDDEEDQDDDAQDRISPGSGGLGKMAVTKDQVAWLNGPRSSGALAAKLEAEDTADGEGDGKGRGDSAGRGASQEAYAGSPDSRAAKEGRIKTDTTGDASAASPSKPVQQAQRAEMDRQAGKAPRSAEALGSNENKGSKGGAAASDSSPMANGKGDKSGGGGGERVGRAKSGGGLTWLYAMAGISPAPSPLLMGAAAGGFCVLLIGALAVRRKLSGNGGPKQRGGDASGSYFSIEMGEADLEAGVMNEEFDSLATESDDVRAGGGGGGGGRRDSNEGDGWGDEDGWGEDFEDQISYPTLTALNKNGIKVLFDFEKSDPDSFTTIIMATIRNSGLPAPLCACMCATYLRCCGC